jgi:hypothetical protein
MHEREIQRYPQVQEPRISPPRSPPSHTPLGKETVLPFCRPAKQSCGWLGTEMGWPRIGVGDFTLSSSYGVLSKVVGIKRSLATRRGPRSHKSTIFGLNHQPLLGECCTGRPAPCSIGLAKTRFCQASKIASLKRLATWRAIHGPLRPLHGQHHVSRITVCFYKQYFCFTVQWPHLGSCWSLAGQSPGSRGASLGVYADATPAFLYQGSILGRPGNRQRPGQPVAEDGRQDSTVTCISSLANQVF